MILEPRDSSKIIKQRESILNAKLLPDLDCFCTASPISVFPTTSKIDCNAMYSRHIYNDVNVTLELFDQLEKIRNFQIKHLYGFISVLNVLVRWTASLISCRPKQTKLEHMI